MKNLPASIHSRLKREAKSRDIPFRIILQYYAFERFLYRLSNSKHSHVLVLKGGLMFFGWGLPLRRFTQDIDFQGFTENTLDTLIQIVKDVCNQPVEPDGLEFDSESVGGEIIMPESEYGGIGISLKCYLGKASIVIKIDVGFADEITPSEIFIDYPTLLGELNMSSFQIQGYPYETSIAQKLHVMVKKDILNSRLKDYYDIWLLSQNFELKGPALQDAISITFLTRKTAIPSNVPPGLSKKYVEENRLRWEKNYSKNSQVPPDFNEVVADICTFLLPPMFAASKGESFTQTWFPKRGWVG